MSLDKICGPLEQSWGHSALFVKGTYVCTELVSGIWVTILKGKSILLQISFTWTKLCISVFFS